jgi:hypothetical protein
MTALAAAQAKQTRLPARLQASNLYRTSSSLLGCGRRHRSITHGTHSPGWSPSPAFVFVAVRAKLMRGCAQREQQRCSQTPPPHRCRTSSVVKTAPAVLCEVGEIIADDVTLIKRMLVGPQQAKPAAVEWAGSGGEVAGWLQCGLLYGRAEGRIPPRSVWVRALVFAPGFKCKRCCFGCCCRLFVYLYVIDFSFRKA